MRLEKSNPTDCRSFTTPVYERYQSISEATNVKILLMAQLISSKTYINNIWDLHSLTVPVHTFLLKCDNKYDLDTDDRTLQVYPFQISPLRNALLYLLFCFVRASEIQNCL